MIRFVVGPDRSVVPDLAARLPGRGIWLSATGDVLESFHAKGDAFRQLTRAFARAARGPVSVPPDLPVVLEAALVRRFGELLGFARRAGQAVAGFEKAREWLRAGQARLVVQASDGSEAERARFLSGAAENLTVVAPLTGAALGRMFGRDYVVHVAIAPGRLAESLAIEAARLAGLRTLPMRDGSVTDGSTTDQSGRDGPGRNGPGRDGQGRDRLRKQEPVRNAPPAKASPGNVPGADAGQESAGLNKDAGANG